MKLLKNIKGEDVNSRTWVYGSCAPTKPLHTPIYGYIRGINESVFRSNINRDIFSCKGTKVYIK